MVPVKNRATLVLRTLNSIKAQTWRPINIIVVDNASTDGTWDSVGQWIASNSAPDFQVSLEYEATPGAACARNRGLEAVDTRLMMFFDSDDIMHPRHIERIMARFHTPDQPDLVYFRVLYHPIAGGDRITKKPGSDLMVTHICHALFRTQGYACETALARRAGGWDSELGGWDDLEFGTRIFLEARNRAYIPDVNVEVFARADSITGTQFRSRRGEWEKAIEKMDSALEKSKNYQSLKWRKVLAYKKTILAASYRREGDIGFGDSLMREVMNHELLNGYQKWFLRLVYKYAAMGGRGSASLINMFF